MRGSCKRHDSRQGRERRPKALRVCRCRWSGASACRFNGRPIELRTRKAGAVLGYLALSESKQESRERLVGLLWSRSDEEKARASLRQVVRELRSGLEEAGYGGFVAERLMIGISMPDRWKSISRACIQLAENGAFIRCCSIRRALDERLLEGMDDLDPSFRVWVLAKRQTIHERLMRSLEAGLIGANVPRDTKKKFAAAIVNLDPTHEDACRYLMRAHAEEGDTAGALRIYKALWDLLDRDYGMEPSPATEELVASIKLGVFERPPADRRAPMRRMRVAVRTISGPVSSRVARWPCQCAGQDAPGAAALCDAWHRRGPRPSGAGVLPSISPHVSCASGNGAWSIGSGRRRASAHRVRRRNTASKPPPIRRAPKSTS